MKNKRGQITFLLIFFIMFALVIMVTLGAVSWTFGLVDEQLSAIDFELANQSWNESYNQGLGPALEAASTTGPQMMSMGLLFGMILVMMFIGYYAEIKSRLWVLLDMGVLIVAEILAGLSAVSFRGVMNITPELFDVYSTTLSAGSKFIINLPIIVPIVGVLIMIMTNIVNKIKKKEEPVRF